MRELVTRLRRPIEPKDHLLGYQVDLDRAIDESNQAARDPAVLAHAATDATRRHDAISVEDLRTVVESCRAEGDLLAQAAEDLIQAYQERGALMIQRLRAHTEKMALLREELCKHSATLRSE